jgi:hypothetical protein
VNKIANPHDPVAGLPFYRELSRRRLLSGVVRLPSGVAAAGLAAGMFGSTPAYAAPYPSYTGVVLKRVDPLWLWRKGCGSDQWPHTAVDGSTIMASWGDGYGWQHLSREVKSYIGQTRIGGTAVAPTATDVWCDRMGETVRALSLKPQALLKVGSEIFVYASSRKDARDRTLLYRIPSSGTSFSKVSDSVMKRSVEGLQVVGAVYRPIGATGDLVLLLAQHGGLESGELYVGEPKNPRVWAARVRPQNLANIGPWEWFCGLDGSNQPIWSTASVRNAVFTTTTGRTVVPVFEDSRGAGKHVLISWCPSLNGYVLAKTQNWLELGLFFAPTPFGSWQTLFYGPFVPKGAATDSRIFTAQIVTMWSQGGTVAVMWSGAPRPTPCSDPNSGNYDAVHLTRFTASIV